MKRVFFTTAMLFAIFSCANAQKAFDESSKVLSLGVGFGSPYWPTGFSSSLPVNPTLTFEKAVTDQISAGTTFAYSSTKYYDYDIRFNAVYLGGRGAYHFSIPNEKVDLYAGAGLGYAIVFVSSKYGSTWGASSGLAYSLFGGGRYYFSKRVAAYAELGYGSFSVANVGLSISSK